MISYTKKHLENFNTITDHKIGDYKKPKGYTLRDFPRLHVATKKYEIKPFHFQTVDFGIKYKPTTQFKTETVKDKYMELNGIDNYHPEKEDKTITDSVNHEDLLIQRYRAGANQPTILEASILGETKKTNPREEFLRLYKLSRMKPSTSSTTTTPSSATSKPPITIMKAVKTEKEKEEEEEEKKMKKDKK